MQVPTRRDQDMRKGAVEGNHPTEPQHGNENADTALDEEGRPIDEVAISEDVVGANADGTEG